jgi:hypothetical protein
MRAQAPNANADSLICALREVGSFNVADTGIGVVEVRQDMTTAAQGANAGGRGFSPPSLLGVSVAGPLMHAGNARTLEGLLSETFAAHHRALAANFLDPAGNAAQNATDRLNLIHFHLSLDESTATIASPGAPGATGGTLCAAP